MSAEIRLEPDVERAWVSFPSISYILVAYPSGDTSIEVTSGALAIIPWAAPRARQEADTIRAMASINNSLIPATPNLLPSLVDEEVIDFFFCIIVYYPACVELTMTYWMKCKTAFHISMIRLI